MFVFVREVERGEVIIVSQFSLSCLSFSMMMVMIAMILKVNDISNKGDYPFSYPHGGAALGYNNRHFNS